MRLPSMFAWYGTGIGFGGCLAVTVVQLGVKPSRVLLACVLVYAAFSLWPRR